MEKKKNNWRVATLVMLLFICGIFCYNIVMVIQNQNYKITNSEGLTFEISKNNFEKLTSNLQPGQFTKIDDLIHNSEITTIKIK